MSSRDRATQTGQGARLGTVSHRRTGLFSNTPGCSSALTDRYQRRLRCWLLTSTTSPGGGKTVFSFQYSSVVYVAFTCTFRAFSRGCLFFSMKRLTISTFVGRKRNNDVYIYIAVGTVRMFLEVPSTYNRYVNPFPAHGKDN